MENKTTQLYEFDVMRAVAIIGVFFVHCQYAIYPDFDFSYGRFFFIVPAASEKFKYMSMSPFAFGWAGVILFFLISGFLIHYATLKRGLDKFKLGLFFNRRFWRIYPVYVIALLFFTFSKHHLFEIIHHPKDFLSHLLLINNFSEKYFFTINGVFWSLATEAQLYLLYPLFLYFSIKKGTKLVVQVLFFLGLLMIVLSAVSGSVVIGNSVFKHWFIWGLGAYLGECYFYKKRVFQKIPNWLLILLFMFFYFSKFLAVHSFSDHYFIAILFAICIEKYLYRGKGMSLIERILIPVGLCSYSIYLFHMPFIQELYYGLDFFHLSNGNRAAFFLVNSIPVFLLIFFISYASYLFLETKSIKFGNSFFEKYFSKKDQNK